MVVPLTQAGTVLGRIDLLKANVSGLEKLGERQPQRLCTRLDRISPLIEGEEHCMLAALCRGDRIRKRQ